MIHQTPLHRSLQGQWSDHFQSGVNAHFQNSMAEKRICDLQDAMRMMLVHAKHCWPKAVNVHLWLYALCTANEIHANTQRVVGQTPIEKLSDGATATSPRHFHPFGCPVNVLNDHMQAGIKGPKWEEHARVGVYLGNSPIHACNITLVLSTETRLVSHQFYVQFDDLFETVQSAHMNIHWDKATEFSQGQSQDTAQQPPIPDTYFLPQAECDSKDTLTQETEVEVFSIKQTFNLPQRKMGSMTDVQLLTHEQMLKQSNIRSDNTQSLDGEPVLQHNTKCNDNPSTATGTTGSNNTSQPSSAQQSSTVNTTPRNNPATEPTATQLRTRIIRLLEQFRNNVPFIAQAWDTIWEVHNFEIQQKLQDPIVFTVTSNPDTMYYSNVKAPD